MDQIDWIYSYGFIGTRLFDLPSFLICVTLILIFGYKYKVSYSLQLILILHALLPFALNDILFDPSYMPDQFKYWRGVNSIRSGDISFFDALQGGNVLEASAIFSLFPFPTPVSVSSLGFYNTFLYIILFFILHKKNIFTRVSLWFYLLYPSFALYTALSLRETLIIFFMTLTVLYARESKVFKSIICLTPLFLIKFQNFFILAPVVLLYFILKVANNGLGIYKALTIIIIGFIGLIAAAPIAIPNINYFRGAMYREDGGEGSVELISGISDFVKEGLTSGAYFIVKPFLWEAQGVLQVIQSLENSLVLIILFLITRQAWHKSLDKLSFWLLFIIFSMSIYGLVVFNYGTAARYRYPFVIIYILFVCSDCNVQHIFSRKAIAQKQL